MKSQYLHFLNLDKKNSNYYETYADIKIDAKISLKTKELILENVKEHLHKNERNYNLSIINKKQILNKYGNDLKNVKEDNKYYDEKLKSLENKNKRMVEVIRNINEKNRLIHQDNEFRR